MGSRPGKRTLLRVHRHLKPDLRHIFIEIFRYQTRRHHRHRHRHRCTR